MKPHALQAIEDASKLRKCCDKLLWLFNPLPRVAQNGLPFRIICLSSPSQAFASMPAPALTFAHSPSIQHTSLIPYSSVWICLFSCRLSSKIPQNLVDILMQTKLLDNNVYDYHIENIVWLFEAHKWTEETPQSLLE
ncbi:hypothetical protein KP509_28G012500 [Ceratopteris richardii]|uniref:Uncharacterized protein n=1 Tax=Ceratopteris richardii TaxID=49495 RepID=A0A8T2RBC9_CERRI|nr:hypothetical protein KP509_28G012500 [Ceratopteris richardii]